MGTAERGIGPISHCLGQRERLHLQGIRSIEFPGIFSHNAKYADGKHDPPIVTGLPAQLEAFFETRDSSTVITLPVRQHGQAQKRACPHGIWRLWSPIQGMFKPSSPLTQVTAEIPQPGEAAAKMKCQVTFA